MANKLSEKTYCWLSMDCENEECPHRLALAEAVRIFVDGSLAAYAPHPECVFAAALAQKYGSMSATMEWLRIDKIEAEVARLLDEMAKAKKKKKKRG